MELLKTFRRGTHPPHNKGTRDMATVDFSTPNKVYISTAQHIGKPAEPVVAVGDTVHAGQLIAKASGFVSANVYSSVSGTVTALVKRPTALGNKVLHIEIDNDGEYVTDTLAPLENPDKAAIIERIKEAGIVGMGGATFPTHIKMSPSKPVDTLIINAAECEPYITCDFRLLLECTDDFLDGVRFLMQALGVDKAFVGIENNKKEAVVKLRSALGENSPIVVCPLKAKYPQGAEKQLIYAITRRKVPIGGLPMDSGVVVCNAHTAYSVCRAVKYAEPCYKRAMTVAGDGVEKKGNYWVRAGVTYQDLYDALRGDVDESVTVKVLSGGPMMGLAQADLQPSTGKGSSSLLFLSEKQIAHRETTQCINCAKCVHGCPMNLLPGTIEDAANHEDYAKCKSLGVLNCIECGVCTYNCPAKRPILQQIRLAKKIIREKKL